MCTSKPKVPEVEPPAPAPAPPPVLEQAAPKAKSDKSDADRKRTGLSKYKLPTIPTSTAPKTQTNKLGGIPKKVGTG